MQSGSVADHERAPSHGEVFNALSPVLHKVFGFVPLDVREDIAQDALDRVHAFRKDHGRAWHHEAVED